MNQGHGKEFRELLFTMLKMMLKAYHMKRYTGIFQLLGVVAVTAGSGEPEEEEAQLTRLEATRRPEIRMDSKDAGGM